MIFDAHFHIIDPNFPLIANNGYLPSPFTVEDYQHRINTFDIKGGAIVSGSFQATNQSYLIAALKKLGPKYVGVTQLVADVSDEQILELHQAGVRAVRFNLFRGGSDVIEHMSALANRIYDLVKWHIELYIDSSELEPLLPTLLELPQISIDHLGLSKSGFPLLLKLVEQGAKVKATGFMRVNFDIASALKQIHSVNPAALMFGTDLPGTRATRQFNYRDLQIIYDCFDDESVQKILWDNAAELYCV